MNYSIPYRKDIDGLRAFAVLSVIFFHYEVLGFRGGFIGVDVFFVISGFLIGGHIADEIASERFSLLSFYERRVRRIFPALFFMLAMVFCAAWVILIPPDFQQFSYSVVNVVGFVSNIRFYWDYSGYANEAARRIPLLHTWSLAVEEQFYLLFPLFMMLFARLTSRSIYFLLPILASFFLCAIIVRVDQPAAFFLPQYRAWELLLGALLPLSRLSQIDNRQIRSGLCLLGLLLIGGSDLLLSQKTPFPSEFALLPCGGTILILYSSCDKSLPIGRVLDNPILVGVGLISYSLYLFHWPLLVLAQYYAFQPLSVGVRALLLFATFLIATVSWRFVERPFRTKSGRFNRRQIFALATMASVTLLIVSTAAFRGYINPIWLPSDERGLLVSLTSHQMQCNGLKATPTLMEQFCKFGNAAASTRTLLWGDSYALSALPGVEAAFVAHGNGVYLSELAGCPPLLDVEVEPYHPAFGGILQKLLIAAGVHSKLACAEHNRQVLIWIAEDHIQNVILVGRWAHYVETVNDAKGGETQIELTDAQTPEGTPAANPAVFTRGLDRLLTVTKALHVKVFVMDSVPEFSQSIPHAMAAEQRLGTHWDLALPKAEYEMRQRQVSRILNNLQRGFDFMRLSPQDVLCSPSACEAERDGHPLYLDGEHLSPLGAIAIQPALEPIWQDAR